MHHRLRYAVPAALIALSACDGVMTYGRMTSGSSVPESQFIIAAEKGAMVAEVGGNPFPMPAERFAEAVRAYMSGANWGPRVRFVETAGPGTVTPYRVVAMFNLAPGYGERDLCGGTDGLRTAPGQARLTLAMAFCFGHSYISGTRGSVRSVAGTDDANFAALVRQTTLTLVPIFQPRMRGD